MRTSTAMVIAAAGLGVAILAADGIHSAQAARITLGMCIRNNEGCRSNCRINAPLPPPYRWDSCYNRCIDNHAACVDKAMENSAAQSVSPTKRPKRLGTKRQDGGATSPASILGDGTGISGQEPSATGVPAGAASGGPSLR